MSLCRPSVGTTVKPDQPPPIGHNYAFVYPLDLKQTPMAFANATVMLVWYALNVYHDVLYSLGWDKKAGNFQYDNLGKGGVECDSVKINVRGDFNSASFVTSPDGSGGRISLG
ncbi:peptidase M36 [Ilyonectria destructans]|nr:peptidase M36 [Ilyonectria destructans]